MVGGVIGEGAGEGQGGLVTHKPAEVRFIDVTVTYPNATKFSSSNTIGGRGAAAKAAEDVKDAWYSKRAVIPAGVLVPVAFETYGTVRDAGGARRRVHSQRGASPSSCGDSVSSSP